MSSGIRFNYYQAVANCGDLFGPVSHPPDFHYCVLCLHHAEVETPINWTRYDLLLVIDNSNSNIAMNCGCHLITHK